MRTSAWNANTAAKSGDEPASRFAGQVVVQGERVPLVGVDDDVALPGEPGELAGPGVGNDGEGPDCAPRVAVAECWSRKEPCRPCRLPTINSMAT